MIDVLYILGRGSKHEDMELRLSLRCLYENAKNIDRLFIVGNCPEWVNGVHHIPMEDTYVAETNAFLKILRACESDISNEFLLMNDDFFMLKPFDAEKYPFYCRGFLKDRIADDPYGQSIKKTCEFLESHNKPNPLDFEVHCPIRINKGIMSLFKDTAESIKREPTGYLCRSLYCNIFNKNGVGCKDTKIREDKWQDPNETGCISTSDNCDQILAKLETMYNTKCGWEK